MVLEYSFLWSLQPQASYICYDSLVYASNKKIIAWNRNNYGRDKMNSNCYGAKRCSESNST